MAHKILRILLLASYTLPLWGSISIVYNLRIAETTKHLFFDSIYTSPSLAALTPFGQYRKSYSNVHQHDGGALFSLIYFPRRYYLRVDTAVAHVSQESAGIKTGRTQTDDLLFSAGNTFPLSHRAQITLSGLLGIPTHRDTSLDKVQFGYGHVGVGGQLDGSVVYMQSPQGSIRYAVRYIRFFPRHITHTIDGIRSSFRFNNGNLIDLFIAHHMNFADHRIEVGYNPSFLFGSSIYPALTATAAHPDYIRNSFYANYKYKFLICTHPSTFALAASYGFDFRPKNTGLKRIITIWGSWAINF